MLLCLNFSFCLISRLFQEMKSKVAAKAVKMMNPAMRIQAYADGVLPETENIFDDKFFVLRINSVHIAFDQIDSVFFPKPVLVRLGVFKFHMSHIDIHESGTREKVFSFC